MVVLDSLLTATPLCACECKVLIVRGMGEVLNARSIFSARVFLRNHLMSVRERTYARIEAFLGY